MLLASEIAGSYDSLLHEADSFAGSLKQYLGSEEAHTAARGLAEHLKDSEHVFLLGRGQHYYIALEAALKLKETTYVHAEGFAAGELKHGVIALIEKGTPVIVFAADDEHRQDILSAAAEVKARGAYVIGVAEDRNELFDMFVPVAGNGRFSALASVLPMQLTAYELAIGLGLPPDKPRNLAKSVTVK
ncbi:MAG: Glutamine--fructose-6-phosphate aminotransferase (isomerizing) [candidate division WS6 bacterium OLB20]|uniref:Glutamine--fructose-6-phosphate aminotransferase [isomerizing] n=1 Tax=candidate division WS6 bacterium OLB20 TaxID=1617426 RepID=A0A136LXQ8_9BACT|nr:MAG: Glutamine--fructose-6-phosphate aminotransferase (isomerizing) [candidate division WS6 bacterium OLB20]